MKNNFRELYKKLVQSKWFKRIYDNKSVGEIIKVITPQEKLTKLRQLADAMYEAAQNMSTDASRLKKAMQEPRRRQLQKNW